MIDWRPCQFDLFIYLFFLFAQMQMNLLTAKIPFAFVVCAFDLKHLSLEISGAFLLTLLNLFPSFGRCVHLSLSIDYYYK